MRSISIMTLSALLLTMGLASKAQEKKADSNFTEYKKPHRSITEGTVTVEGNLINYQAVAGTLILKNNLDTPTASIFFTAYFKTGGKDVAQRPITFIYNGGPGSATIWLHMGAFGPQRVYLKDTARTKAPYKTISNEYSLLDASDLVFIDAPGTGFGKIITKEMGGAGVPKDFFGIDQDGQAFASFIHQFLSEYNRWNSPKYLFGESYGTFRSAVVANILQSQYSVSLNGVILLSQLLTYNNMTETTDGNPGDGLPFELVLPSYAATAWYHNKIPNKPKDLEPFLKEVETFALNDYAVALNKGTTLDSVSFNQIAQKLHDYTGLPVDYIRKGNLRINGPQFEQALLGEKSQITGRLDSRFSGPAPDPLSEYAQYDPMDSYIDGAFTATFNNYVRTELKYGKDLPYKTSGDVYPWDFKRGGGFIGSPNVMADLAQAMIYNPDLKVMLNGGYFDLGTPYFEGVYEMQHLPMPASLQKNITYARYFSGHMVYLHPESLKTLHDNVASFIRSTY